MREKLLWATGIVVLGLLAAYSQQRTPSAPALASGEVGRYQLCVGPMVGSLNNALFRIDTRTGKTWVQGVVTRPDGSTKPLVWLPLEESDLPR